MLKALPYGRKIDYSDADVMHDATTLVARWLIIDTEFADTDKNIARTGVLTIEQDARFEMALPPSQRPIDVTREYMVMMQIHIEYHTLGEELVYCAYVGLALSCDGAPIRA